jgi:hypothetical protein
MNLAGSLLLFASLWFLAYYVQEENTSYIYDDQAMSARLVFMTIRR